MSSYLLIMWFFFQKVRIEFLPFLIRLLFSLPFDFFFKSKNWVLTFLLTMFVCLIDWFFFCSFVFVCLGFWKVRIEFLPFTYHDIFFQKDRALTFFLTMFVCLIVSLFIWFCLFVWVFEKLELSSYFLLTMWFFFSNVRVGLLPFFLPCCCCCCCCCF